MTATATNFAVAGESLCDQFGSNVIVMSQTRRCRWMYMGSNLGFRIGNE